jgi:hypothetical protein
MPQQPLLECDALPSEDERAALDQAMAVVADPDPDRAQAATGSGSIIE